jgi:hypothetical protein
MLSGWTNSSVLPSVRPVAESICAMWLNHLKCALFGEAVSLVHMCYLVMWLNNLRLALFGEAGSRIHMCYVAEPSHVCSLWWGR